MFDPDRLMNPKRFPRDPELENLRAEGNRTFMVEHDKESSAECFSFGVYTRDGHFSGDANANLQFRSKWSSLRHFGKLVCLYDLWVLIGIWGKSLRRRYSPRR
jgi:hypothetical protein